MTIHAAGIVLYEKADANRRRYLLLRNAQHGTWGFAKGHLEPGEDPLAAARRETAEETGMALFDIDPDFEMTVAYEVRGARGVRYEGGVKHTAYYLARTEAPTLELSAEHDRGVWLDAEKALETLQFDNLRDLLKAIEAYLESR